MYLDKILGSKTKVNLLSVLVSRPERNIIESDLAKEAGVSVSETNRQIIDLVTIGLVAFVRVGKSKVYQVNQNHFLFEPLRVLFRSLEEVYREIAYDVTTFVKETSEVKAVILFGSLASGKVREDFVKNPSDLDLVIVVQDEDQIEFTRSSALNYVGSKVFPVYGVNVYPIVLSVNEYLSGLSNDVFIMNVHSGGEVLYGEKPSGFD
jgi:predicted nucleotidyltransferase